MNLSNPIENIAHHLLIKRMTCLGYWDEFPMVSVLMYVMLTEQDLQWTMTQGYQFSWFTKLLYFMDSQPWKDIELVPKSIGGFDLWVDLKVVIYPYGLGHCWWKLVAIGILNRGTMISHGIETVSPWVIQRTCDQEIYGHSNSFSGIWHMLLKARVC